MGLFGLPIKGPAGEGIYQAWLRLGNTGTEEDMFKSFKGENGKNGEARKQENKIPTTGIETSYAGEIVYGTYDNPITESSIKANMTNFRQASSIIINYKGIKPPIFDDNFTVLIDESNFNTKDVNVIQIWTKFNKKGGIIAAITV